MQGMRIEIHATPLPSVTLGALQVWPPNERSCMKPTFRVCWPRALHVFARSRSVSCLKLYRMYTANHTTTALCGHVPVFDARNRSALAAGLGAFVYTEKMVLLKEHMQKSQSLCPSTAPVHIARCRTVSERRGWSSTQNGHLNCQAFKF